LGIYWFYKPANVYGGPLNCVSTMLEGLVSDGVDVTVLTTNVNGHKRLDVPLGEPVLVSGVRVYYFPVSFDLLSINYSLQLARAFANKVHEFDLVISGLLWHPFLLDKIINECSKAKVPYVVQLFGQLMPWALTQKSLKKKLFLFFNAKRYLNQASALQCTDPIEVDSVNQMGLTSPVILIPNGIDKSQYSSLPPRGLFRQELEINKGEIVLLFLGRLHHVKRPELALESIIKLGRKDVHLIYAGHDEEGFTSSLNKRAVESGYSSQVHFIGNLNKDEVLQAFSDSDLLIMPSQQENFGMSAAEALISGVPILTSKFVPVGISATKAGAGRLADLTIESFTQELQVLLKNPEKLKQMGLLGKEFAKNNYDQNIIGENIISEYSKIINR